MCLYLQKIKEKDMKETLENIKNQLNSLKEMFKTDQEPKKTDVELEKTETEKTNLELEKTETEKTDVELEKTTETEPEKTDVELEESNTETEAEQELQDEVTIEVLQEQIIGLSETVADLVARIEALEGGNTDTETETEMKNETDMSKQIKELEDKIAEMSIELEKANTVEPIGLSKEPKTVTDAKSYGVRLKAQIEKQRKELGK